MSTAPPPNGRPTVPSPNLLAVWPHSAQNVLCFFLGILVTVIAWNGCVALRGPRPTDLTWAPEPTGPRAAVSRPMTMAVGLQDHGPFRPVTTADPAESVAAKVARLQGRRVDVNRAPLDELQLLPGIGLKLAQRILDERHRRPFVSVEELRRVHGIGSKTLEKLRPHVTVGSAPIRVVAVD